MVIEGAWSGPVPLAEGKLHDQVKFSGCDELSLHPALQGSVELASGAGNRTASSYVGRKIEREQSQAQEPGLACGPY
jgi:hypothetical protein